MAQAVSISETGDNGNMLFKGVQKIVWTWTAHTDGTVVASTTTGQNPTTSSKYTGKCIRLITDPGTSNAPTDNYDITILDEDGYDVLMGAGIDRDTSNTEQVLESSLGICLYSTLSLRIAAAGSGGKGVVILYIK